MMPVSKVCDFGRRVQAARIKVRIEAHVTRKLLLKANVELRFAACSHGRKAGTPSSSAGLKMRDRVDESNRFSSAGVSRKRLYEARKTVFVRGMK
jgi:hypothetical protein